MRIIRFERYKEEQAFKQLATDKKESSNKKAVGLEGNLFQEDEKPRIVSLPDYLRTDSDKYGEGAVVNYVTLGMLPHGENWQVLGMYEPGRHVMYVARDMPTGQVEHTKRHERVHSFGVHDEILTDRLSASDLSYREMSAAA